MLFICLQVNQPSAAKQLMDFDKKPVDKKPEFGIGTEFGLKLDQYSKKTGALKNKSAASQAREWTEQETLLLLEALEVSSCWKESLLSMKGGKQLLSLGCTKYLIHYQEFFFFRGKQSMYVVFVVCVKGTLWQSSLMWNILISSLFNMMTSENGQYCVP